jgi:hypothetical protein
MGNARWACSDMQSGKNSCTILSHYGSCLDRHCLAAFKCCMRFVALAVPVCFPSLTAITLLKTCTARAKDSYILFFSPCALLLRGDGYRDGGRHCVTQFSRGPSRMRETGSIMLLL